MRYINTKTGAVINSPCFISGGDWVKDSSKQKTAKSEATKEVK